jgi:hypothetical protein
MSILREYMSFNVRQSSSIDEEKTGAMDERTITNNSNKKSGNGKTRTKRKALDPMASEKKCRFAITN